MVAFEIRVNGEPVAVIGVGEAGSMSAAVSWNGEWWRWFQGGEYGLDLSGRDATGTEFRWAAPQVRPGDEIAVRVIEAEAADPPLGSTDDPDRGYDRSRPPAA